MPRPSSRRSLCRGWSPWALLGWALPLLVAVVLEHRAAPRAPTVPERESVAYVVPYGEVSATDLARAAWALEEGTRRPVVVLSRRLLPERAQRADGQLEGHVMLDELLWLAPDDAFRILGVTDQPLANGAEPLIGFARQGERALVYSTDQLAAVATEGVQRQRVRRVVLHELGHTHGAGHCEHACVMHGTTAVSNIDHLPDQFCPEHRALAQQALSRSIDHPEVVAGVAHERLRLGQWGAAASGFRQAIGRRPRDPKLRTSLGVALMAGGELSSAEDALREAARLSPRSPQPYYALAVLYAAGQAPRRAPAFLEAAVSRDADPQRAHRAAGILYQDVIGDDQQAVRHFEAYVHSGGREPGIIARLVYLVAPATVTFSRPEVVVARWLPGVGMQLARAAP